MNIPVISWVMATVKSWQDKEKLKSALEAEYRELVCSVALSAFEGNFDDVVLAMRKRYEALGLSEKETRSVIADVNFVRIEG